MNQPAGCGGSGRALLGALLHAGAAVDAALERSLEPWGLSRAKMGALHHLAAAPAGLPLGQLAERLACVKSNVTQLVDRLEADGLVRRVPDPQDRRSVLAQVTPRGRERFEVAARAQERAEAAILDGLSADERERLADLLRRVEGGAR